MNEFVTRLMAQSPMAAAIILVILIFMRYLKDRDSSNRQYHREQREEMANMFKRFQEEHLHARGESKDAVQRNTSALETNVSATNRNSYVIESLVKSIDNLAHKNGNGKI